MTNEAKNPVRPTAPIAPRLEHANLVVTEIEPTVRFLKVAFPDWEIRGEGRDEWAGMPRRWVHLGTDETYITLNDFGRGRQRDLQSATPGLAHLGFEVADIDTIIARLRDAGYEPDHFGPDHPHRRNAYFHDPEGLEFEFVEYFSTNPAERNLYV